MTDDELISAGMAILGKRGGNARAANMPADERSAAASAAAKARWQGMSAEQRAEQLAKMREGKQPKEND